jgi:hypothetical protein
MSREQVTVFQDVPAIHFEVRRVSSAQPTSPSPITLTGSKTKTEPKFTPLTFLTGTQAVAAEAFEAPEIETAEAEVLGAELDLMELPDCPAAAVPAFEVLQERDYR